MAYSGSWASATAWTPLIYDTVVVSLVVLRTRDIVRAKIARQSQVVATLVKDGLLYFTYVPTLVCPASAAD
jgi:hypothetical protein